MSRRPEQQAVIAGYHCEQTSQGDLKSRRKKVKSKQNGEQISSLFNNLAQLLHVVIYSMASVTQQYFLFFENFSLLFIRVFSSSNLSEQSIKAGVFSGRGVF